MRTMRKTALVAIAVLAIGAGSVWAQQSRSRRDDDQQSRQGRQTNQMQDRSRQQQDDIQYRLRPAGWIAIGYDFNDDQKIDAIEYIYSYDLARARETSQRRMRDEQARRGGSRQQDWSSRQQQWFDRQGQTARRPQQWDRQDQTARRPQQWDRQQRQSQRPYASQDRRRMASENKIRGTIRDIQTFRVDGEDHLMFKIDTESGNVVRTDLGPRSQVRRMGINEGDKVTVWGHRGTIDGRRMLIASRAQAAEQKLVIRRNRAQQQIKLEGTLTQKKNMTIDGQKMVVGLLKTQDRQVPICLGSQKDLQSVDIQAGDEIKVLARPTQMQGRQRLKATQIYTGDEYLSVD